jgi:PAS domain S-box-containing protein
MSEAPPRVHPTSLEQEVLQALLQTLDTGRVGLTVTAVDVDPPEYLFVSTGAAEMLGYTVEELIAVPIWELFPKENVPALRARRKERLLDPSGTHRLELYIRHSNGSFLPFEVTTTRVQVGGRPANVSFTNDISQRVEALRALEASETRFRTLVESAPDGVAILRGTTISYLNGAGATMLGIDRPERGVGLSITSLLNRADVTRAENRISQLQRTQQRFAESAEYRSRRRDGREIIMEISSTPIEFEGAPATLAFARDITERKAMHEKMVQADRLAAVGTLAAGIAHEINNPLAYVLLGIQYLERELPKVLLHPERMNDMLARLSEVRTGAERVGGIVSGLKMFARADEAERGPVDLRDVVDAAIKIADNEIRHRARLVRTYEDNVLVQGNAARLEQVFLNLLVNAAHAVEGRQPASGEIKVHLRSPSADRVIAEVSDNGAGVAEDVLPRVFDPFFTTKPVGVGTGLGLPICRSIVEGFGGTITMHSELGRGTTVRVSLPAQVDSDLPGVTEPRVAPSSFPPLPRGKVLVVDDEALVAGLLSRMISGEHDVVIATSAMEAMSLIERTDFDAVVCDVMMPGMTGMDLYQVVRAKMPALAERMIFVTGGAFVPHVADFLSSVENPKLDKPLDLRALLKVLREIRRREPQPVGRSASPIDL